MEIGNDVLSGLYRDYLIALERGVKREKKEALNALIEGALRSERDARRALVMTVCERDQDYTDEFLLQFPLFQQVVLPVMVQGARDRDGESLRLLARFARVGERLALIERAMGAINRIDLLERAVDAEPGNETAWSDLLELHLRELDDATHHLPKGLLWPVAECREVLAAAADVIARSPAPLSKGADDVERFTRLLDDWEAFEADAAHSDFASWCAAHGRSHAWTPTYEWESE